jgi:lipopolysaccharide export system permease protein
MGLSATLSIYLIRHLCFWLVSVFSGVAAVVLLFDTIEMMRRSASKSDVGIGIVIQMSLLKLPHLLLQMLPFCILFGATLAFWRLSRANELVVSRAAGISVWQILAPTVGIAVLVGILQLAIFNPVASIMLAKYERLESQYLKNESSLLSVSTGGLWLRQADKGGQSVIHAERVEQTDMSLQEVTIFLYEGDDRFVGRIDAERAQLREGFWDIRNAWISTPGKNTYRVDRYRLPTDLTLTKIMDSFASPETLSFWELPAFIATLENAGFSGQRHKLYWQSILASPILLAAMILIAAVFSLRTTGRVGASMSIAGAAFSGFLLYFLSDLVYALGQSSSIPTMLAAWTPAGVTTLLGVALLFHFEDG